jgi:shikimate kinase
MSVQSIGVQILGCVGASAELSKLQMTDDIIKGVSLYLVGMMGSGKSTVGRLLAERLGYGFFDTDTLIEQITGQTPRELFANEGEAAFRALETEVLRQLSERIRLVVATGGGAVLAQQNWQYLRHGCVVWLDVPIAAIAARLQANPAEIAARPLLQTPDPVAALESLLEQRRSRYALADAHLTPTATDTPALIVEQVLTAIAALRLPDTPPEIVITDHSAAQAAPRN